MTKRMTKMEACHHLTVIRDLYVGDLDRMHARLKAKPDTVAGSEEMKRYLTQEIAEAEARIRALEMAGAALTR